MYRLSIASQYRDESQYLREWVEYHLLVGFEHVFLLNHDLPGSAERARSLEILSPYVERRALTVVDHPDPEDPAWQLIGWKHILDAWGRLTEWVLLTDLDSFAFPVHDDSVRKVLDRYERPDVALIAIYLCTFGDSGLLTPPVLQTESFIRRAPFAHASHYSANYLIRPAGMEPPTVKGYGMTDPAYVGIDTDRVVLQRRRGKRKGPLDVLRINHYSIRSKQDWERKVRRGWYGDHENAWTDPNHTLVQHKLGMLNHNEEFDDSMMRFVPELKKRMGL